MMAENLSQELAPHRIFLRFRTRDDAPSDSQILQDFYKLTGLNDEFCSVHWQARQNRDTYVIIDVHCGTKFGEQNVQDLPHEIYQLSWGPESEAMSVPLQKASIAKI